MSTTPPKNQASAVAQVMRRVPLFSQLSDDELARISEPARERSYPKNSVILFEDDPGDALYVVVTGQVKVVLIGEDGREVILSVLGTGEWLEVWDRDTWAAEDEASPDRINELTSHFDHPS